MTTSICHPKGWVDDTGSGLRTFEDWIALCSYPLSAEPGEEGNLGSDDDFARVPRPPGDDGFVQMLDMEMGYDLRLRTEYGDIESPYPTARKLR